MSREREEGPVYYREILKNAYLKRIPIENGSKLRPLGGKKPPLKPLWTLLCVHNGRVPFLEQYPGPDSPGTLSHRPLWRASLHTARHVTASVKPHTGEEYDFLVDCDHGPVRMLAPDWESMQDWVTTLRSKLHELRIVGGGENVYCAPPAPAAPRAPARDPTSPLPPTPPVPLPRVPGIDLTPHAARVAAEPEPPAPTAEPQPQPQPQPHSPIETITRDVDISNWEAPADTNSRLDTSPSLLDTPTPMETNSTQLDLSQPSTSQEASSSSKDTSKEAKSKSVAKICGQNICLDDSILKRSRETTDSDEEFFAEIDRIHDSVENLTFDEISDSYISEVEARISTRCSFRDVYKQTLVVDAEPSTSGLQNDPQPSNITVIKVSNKLPHTAIPVMGPETDVFDFSFKQQLTVNDDKQLSTSNATKEGNFVNIVNTEVNVRNSEFEFPVKNPEDAYGTVFEKEPEYGHISLTTTVNLTGDVRLTDGIYERLCMASVSNSPASPSSVNKIRNQDKTRKSSLPNLDSNISNLNTEPTYEYLFPNVSQTNNVSLNGRESQPTSQILVNGHLRNDELNAESRNNQQIAVTRNHGNCSNVGFTPRHNHNPSTTEIRHVTVNSDVPQTVIASNNEIRPIKSSSNSISEITNRPTNSSGKVTVTNSSSSHRARNVERSHSQNSFDSTNRMRDLLIRRVQNNSPNREGKVDKPDHQSKPIWKRGLTELSLLSRLRGIGQRRHESPTRRHDSPTRGDGDRGVTLTSPVKVVHRSRPEGRLDGARRRSSSLNNGQSPLVVEASRQPLQPLLWRQAAALRAEQRRGALHVVVSRRDRDAMALVDYSGHVWVAWWGIAGRQCRSGDRLASVQGAAVTDAAAARHALKHGQGPKVDVLFHRVPLAKIYVLNKRDLESIGIKLDNECNITGIEPGSPAARAGLPPPGRWAVTEVNNRPINLVKGGQEEMNRASLHGTEVSLVLQPSPLVKKIRAAIKGKASFR